MTDATLHHRPILLMAGGTGGHVFPALAIAEALRAQGVPISWLGTQRGLEARIVPAAGIDLHYISISGLRGKGGIRLAMAPFTLVRAIWQSLRILRVLRPTAVVGMGGFVTGPGGIAARLLGIPLLIHEQNAMAGLTNRWLARLATEVMEAFPNTFPPSCQAHHTGNPLRAGIMALPSSRTLHHPLHILVVGGSLGAQALNEIVPQALQQVQGQIEVWHQTGEAHLEKMQQAYCQAPFQAKVEAFIDNMANAYQWADLVICRAGALTVSELAQAGLASILVPYPHACDDHQTKNAQFLAQKGAAQLLSQAKLSVENLTNLINEFLAHPMRLHAMSVAAQQCALPTALQNIVELCLKYVPFYEQQRKMTYERQWIQS